MKGCLEDEADSYLSLVEHPFMVVRAAGSHGVDLIAMRWDYSFPIEVKSSENDILYMSKTARLIEQAQKMLDDCDRSHVVPIYAFRLKGVKGDPWRIFTILVTALVSPDRRYFSSRS